ncbi:MAG TPA: APC family permease [Bryobacteraceae bacterium]|nr:APC family permease [Bryobacteraceae bacterium]
MAETSPALHRELGLRDLILFNIAALISTRWIGVAAHVGPGAISLWMLAAAFFLLPCAFVVANLSRRFPQEGGLYIWTREAFGPWHAFSCGWFYYLNNLFWIPGVLVAMVGMTMYAFSPRLAIYAENPWCVLPACLALLVVIVAANYLGLRVAKWLDNFGGIGAYYIAGLLVFAAAVMLGRKGSATHFNIVPRFDFEKLNFWSQLAMAMTGLELSPILAGEIKSPERSVFRATWISAFLVAVLYIAATSALLIFLPPDRISTVIGLAQASQQAAVDLGWSWLPFAIGTGILLSVGGQLGTYLGACARLPFVLGIGNLLPPAFAKLHPKFGTPYISILVLGFGSAILLLISQLGESFRGAYQVMVDMTVISLFIPFLYLFATAWKFGQKIASVCGFGVSLLAIVFSFLPTADVKTVWGFETKLVGGCIVLFVLARFCFNHYQAKSLGLPVRLPLGEL